MMRRRSSLFARTDVRLAGGRFGEKLRLKSDDFDEGGPAAAKTIVAVCVEDISFAFICVSLLSLSRRNAHKFESEREEVFNSPRDETEKMMRVQKDTRGNAREGKRTLVSPRMLCVVCIRCVRFVRRAR